MRTIQKQSLEALVRVRAFLDEHPVTAPLGYAGAVETLDDVIRRLREFAGAQVTGRELSRGELRLQAKLVRELVVRHMRPIVIFARTQQDPDSDVRLPASFRMPRANLGPTKVLQACDGMIEAARPFEAAFVAGGLPADFLARLIAARDELERVLGGRATQIGRHVGARAGMQVQLRRGRRVIDRLDAVVRAAFDGDEVTLARWRAARRLHLQPGVPAGRGTTDAQQAA